MATRPSGFGLRTAAVAAPLLLAACATQKVDTQWADPQFTGTSLRGARVLVACDAYDLGVKQYCEQQLASELTARGASPVIGALVPSTPPADVRQQAQTANAQAAMSVRVGLAEVGGSGFPGWVSIGIGGYGGGGRGGGSVGGVGVGVSVPVGGGYGGIANGHTARGTVIDTTSGRAMWNFTITTPSSSDYNTQMGEMARAVGNAAQEAGLLPK